MTDAQTLGIGLIIASILVIWVFIATFISSKIIDKFNLDDLWLYPFSITLGFCLPAMCIGIGLLL